MHTKAAAWASSATPIPMCNAVGFRMALKQILKQMWYLISVTGNVAMLFVDDPMESRYAVCKLYCYAGDELSGMANVSTVSWEEEAGPKTFLFKVSTGDRTGDCRLFRAGQAVQPEDTVLILFISPVVYLSKKLDTSRRQREVSCNNDSDFCLLAPLCHVQGIQKR
jgi:hypothetical protein